MSEEVHVTFEIRDMAIMKDTLKEMGYNYKEVGQDQVTIERRHNDIVISSAGEGSISFDQGDRKAVDGIRQNYMVNFYRDRAIREGMDVEVNKQANGEVEIHLTHGG